MIEMRIATSSCVPEMHGKFAAKYRIQTSWTREVARKKEKPGEAGLFVCVIA
jgi:hypothetical protein